MSSASPRWPPLRPGRAPGPGSPPDRARLWTGPGAETGPGFEVELARAGLTLTVPPGRSILDVVEAAGIPVLSSCTEGTCGPVRPLCSPGPGAPGLGTVRGRAGGRGHHDDLCLAVADPELVLDI